ncbi:MAG: hypothetical protein JJE10_10345 [Thermoleophilia bacterium]|nr:hypothetical protein [Thermoleophilia bacterium]
MRRAASILASLAGALLVMAITVGPAQAANTRVSISDFQWSQDPQIDLGESVTWDWIGPDTQHSVTGQPANATQWDSDPVRVESHPLGDTFTVTFNQPGEYEFICKLHASVRGVVTVSSTPGDPDSDPGPQAPLNLDIDPPDFQGVYLSDTVLGPKGKGTTMNFATDERGTVEADYYIKIKKGGKKKKTVRSFAGFGRWSNHIGYNAVNFAKRTSDFKAKPGKYVARVAATDESANTTPTVELKFEIKKKKKNKKK